MDNFFIFRKKKDENGIHGLSLLDNGLIIPPILPNLNKNLSGMKNGTKYSRMDQVKFVEDSLQRFERVWSALGRPYTIKLFKDCLSQILLGPFLNTLSQMILLWIYSVNMVTRTR